MAGIARSVGRPDLRSDREYRIIRCNAAYARTADLPIEQIIGKPYWNILPKLQSPPPPCELGRPHEGAEARVFGTEKGQIFAEHEVPVPCPAGNFWYCRHLLEDVTERERLERELAREKTIAQAIVESAPNAFFLVDQDMKLVRWNSYGNMGTTGSSWHEPRDHADHAQGGIDPYQTTERAFAVD